MKENKNNALNDEELNAVTGGAGKDGEVVDDGPYYCFDCGKWLDAVWKSNDVVCSRCGGARVTTCYGD